MAPNSLQELAEQPLNVPELGGILKKRRLAKQITLESVSSACGMSVETLALIEANEQPIRSIDFHAIAEFMEVDVGEIMIEAYEQQSNSPAIREAVQFLWRKS